MTRRPTGRPPGRPVKAAVVKAATAVATPPLVGAGMLLSFAVAAAWVRTFWTLPELARCDWFELFGSDHGRWA